MFRPPNSLGSTVEVAEIETLADGTIIIGDGSGAPTTLAAFSSGTGTLKPANGGTGVANNAASTLTISGNFATTLTVTGTTGVTLPTTGTLATLAGSEALTNKSVNGLTVTSSTGTLTIANSKTLTASNTLTLTATDGSTLAIGTGGTLGSAAYTASSAYEAAGGIATHAALTATHGVAGAIVGTTDSQALTNKTYNGNTFTAGTGTLTIAASKTLTANNSITLAGTDSTTMTFPSTTATIARTDAGQTFTGVQVMTSPSITTSIVTGSTTFALFNDTVTTANVLGAATTINLGTSATVLNFGGGATAAELRFLEPSGSGTNYTALKAQAQSANITYTLPATVGGAGTFLKDAAGDGILSWATPSSGATMTRWLWPGEASFGANVTLGATQGWNSFQSLNMADVSAIMVARWNIDIPSGATSISSILVYYEARSTGNVYLAFITGSFDITSLPATPVEDTTQTYTAFAGGSSDNKIRAVTVPADAYNSTTITNQEVFALAAYRDASSASDTYTDTFEIVGILVTFA